MTNPVTPLSAANTSFTPPRDDATTQLVAAFVQKNWDSHYRAAWAKLGTPAGVGSGTTWNWPAALVPIAWLAYRRQWTIAGLAFIASFALSFIPVVNLVAWLGFIIGFGLYGDRIVLKRAWQSADSAMRQHGPGEAATKQVMAEGGTSNAALVFFLILPVAVVVLGILAAIAIPKFASTKEAAYRVQMTSDLRSIRTAEEVYFTDSTRYTADAGALRFTPSTGVMDPEISVGPTGTTYVVTVKHQQTALACALAVGMPNPLGTAADGEPICK